MNELFILFLVWCTGLERTQSKEFISLISFSFQEHIGILFFFPKYNLNKFYNLIKKMFDTNNLLSEPELLFNEKENPQ